MKIKFEGDLITITTTDPDAIGFVLGDGSKLPFKTEIDGEKSATVGGKITELEIEEDYPEPPAEEPIP